MHRLSVFVVVMLLGTLYGHAEVSADSVTVTPDVHVATSDTLTVQKPNFWHRGVIGKVIGYFDKADDPKPLDKFDFSIIGGPFYNKTAGVGIGLCGSGLYHLQPSNPKLQQSSISLTAQATTKGMFSLYARGYNFLPDDRYRSDFEVELTTFKNEFWGFGFDNCDNDDNSSFIQRNQVQARGNFLFRLAPHFYVGPSVYYSLFFADKREQKADSLIGDGPHKTSTLGLGLLARYDSRDNPLSAQRGLYVNLEQRVQPECFGGHSTYTTTELEVCGYIPIWKGCILAGEFHSLINCGNDVPWTDYAKVGGIYRMRGYYEARYRDRNIIEGQIEFRQHIKGRSGIVLFAGFANAFRNTHTWRFNHTLPNYGVGYRWTFKPGVHIRLDLGMTRKGPGFIFAINEAF